MWVSGDTINVGIRITAGGYNLEPSGSLSLIEFIISKKDINNNKIIKYYTYGEVVSSTDTSKVTWDATNHQYLLKLTEYESLSLGGGFYVQARVKLATGSVWGTNFASQPLKPSLSQTLLNGNNQIGESTFSVSDQLVLDVTAVNRINVEIDNNNPMLEMLFYKGSTIPTTYSIVSGANVLFNPTDFNRTPHNGDRFFTQFNYLYDDVYYPYFGEFEITHHNLAVPNVSAESYLGKLVNCIYVKGDRGDTGYYFTPSVDAAGNISWTNNGGLENPQTQNIKGAKGNKGDTALIYKTEFSWDGSEDVDIEDVHQSNFNRTPVKNERFFGVGKSTTDNLTYMVEGYIKTDLLANKVDIHIDFALNVHGAKGNKGDTGNTGATPNITATASVDALVGIPSVTVTKTGTNENPTLAFAFNNMKGEKGDTGDGFQIFRTYASISAMNADAENVPQGKFVLISSNVEDVDNAKLYVRNASGFGYLTDMSGATGIQGERGYGITSVSKTSTSGLVDTYTITYGDGTTSTFNITNGAKGDNLLTRSAMTFDSLPTEVGYNVLVGTQADFNRTPNVGDDVVVYGTYAPDTYLVVGKISSSTPSAVYIGANTKTALKINGTNGTNGVDGIDGKNNFLAGKEWQGSLTLSPYPYTEQSATLYTTDDQDYFRWWNDFNSGDAFWLLSTDGYMYNCVIVDYTSATHTLGFIATNKTRFKGQTGASGDGSFVVTYTANSIPTRDAQFTINENNIIEMISNIENPTYGMFIAKYNGQSYAFIGEYKSTTTSAVIFKCTSTPFAMIDELSFATDNDYTTYMQEINYVIQNPTQLRVATDAEYNSYMNA